MKRLMAVLMAVVAFMGLVVVPAFAVDKLIVKGADGVTTKFVVRDDGSVGLNNATPLGYIVDASQGLVTGSPLTSMNSLLHFSYDGTDTGGWISTASANNFWISSGAALVGGSWIQKAADGIAVIAGSGAVGYRIFTSSGNVVGNPIALTSRMHIDLSGNVGFGIAPTANPLTFANGAILTPGGVWQNASSREYKENIQALSSDTAIETLNNLEPVLYSYKKDADERHVGFIAEDVPALVAAKDRKSLSPMDIVAVLTKVVQEQNKTIEALSAKIEKIEKAGGSF